MLTAIMYHYIKDFSTTKYPKIKGMDIKEFINQVNFIKSHYNVVSIEDIVDCIYDEKPLPPNSAIFTFDDGYIDHYENVYPILKKNNIRGAFYVSIETLKENTILDVNKIHYTLATGDVKQIYNRLCFYVDKYKQEYNLLDLAAYKKTYEQLNRWDTKEVIFIKRMLQKVLPYNLRKKICLSLLEENFTSKNMTDLSKEIYMNIDQLLEMQKNGMHISSHTYTHQWLDTLSFKQQEKEILESFDYLETIGINPKYKTLCYPYGAYNQNTLDILEKNDIKLAWTVGDRITQVSYVNRYTLTRIDCNDVGRNVYDKV
ncbi:hypothetical protein AN641_09610 [Candidatus Epulonipiscioides gigas]|nr:hypothetical protein AN641_09610 [Epulopiscium sp. SCG-C07WGA-EpuloA2]